jgi:hypothetical protein
MMMSSNRLNPRLNFIALLHVVLSRSLVLAEDNAFIEKSDEDSMKLMVVPFILFAFGISLISSTLVCFLWTEMQLLQEFLNGIQVDAKVVDYTRMPHARCVEYLARVEFRDEESVDCGLMRKDVQCYESDFTVKRKLNTDQTFSPRIFTNSDGPDIVSTSCQKESTQSERRIIDMDLEAGEHDALPSSFSFDREKHDPPPRVYIRVAFLRGQPESAIGYEHAVRSTAPVPTILLIGFLISCTCFCFFLGFQLIFTNMSKVVIFEASLLVTLTVIALECVVGFIFAWDAIREMVYQDIIRGCGQSVDLHTEYESLDTWSSSRMSWRTLSNLSKGLSQNRLESKDSSFAM